MITLMLILVFCATSNGKSVIQCTKNEDCPSGTMFCYYSGFCANCTNCTVFHRFFRPGHCAEHPDQCGSCLPGYEEVAFSGNKFRDSCKRSSTTTTSKPASTTFELSHGVVYTIAAGFVLLLSTIIIVIYCLLRNRCNQQDSAGCCRMSYFSAVDTTKEQPYKIPLPDDEMTLGEEPSAPLIREDSLVNIRDASLLATSINPDVQPVEEPLPDYNSFYQGEMTEETFCQSQPFEHSMSPPPVYYPPAAESVNNNPGAQSPPPAVNNNSNGEAGPSPHLLTDNDGETSPPDHLPADNNGETSHHTNLPLDNNGGTSHRAQPNGEISNQAVVTNYNNIFVSVHGISTPLPPAPSNCSQPNYPFTAMYHAPNPRQGRQLVLNDTD